MSLQTLRSILATASPTQRQRIARRISMSTTALASRDAEHLAPWIKAAIADVLEMPEHELFSGDRR
jgi:hypothetical protein